MHDNDNNKVKYNGKIEWWWNKWMNTWKLHDGEDDDNNNDDDDDDD